MRIASRPVTRAGRSAQATFLTMLGVLVLGWMAGCDDNHLGRPCDVNADAGSITGGHVAIVSSPALQCPSRICLLPADQNVAAANQVGAFCTVPCSSDDDCSDGETGAKGSNGGLCTSGFFCGVPTTTGKFCCERYCICRDFQSEPGGGFQTPEVCMQSSSSCPNVH